MCPLLRTQPIPSLTSYDSHWSYSEVDMSTGADTATSYDSHWSYSEVDMSTGADTANSQSH